MKLKQQLAQHFAYNIGEDDASVQAYYHGFIAGFEKAQGMALEICASWNGIEHHACRDIEILGEEEELEALPEEK